RTWLTSSSSSGIARPPASPRAMACRASRKLSTWSAICWARSSTSLVTPGSVGGWTSASGACSVVDTASPFERPAQGDLVGVLEVAAYGQSTRKPRQAQPQVLEQPGEVGRGGLALEVGVGGQDDLGDLAVGEPLQQFLDPQLVGADALDRADRAAEDVVATAELAGALDRHDVLGLLHHAQHGRVAPRITTDPAPLLLGDVAAHRAEADLVLDLGEHRREPAYVGRVGLEDVEGD